MNRLKLHVDQSSFNQNGQLMFLVMQKTLKIVETLHQSLWRRNKRGVARTRSSDPVL